MAHMRECTLKEICEFLLKQKHSFYNNQALLSEIRTFSWDAHIKRVTQENTQKNAEYSTCQIFYKLNKKRVKLEERELPPACPKKVSFLEEHLPPDTQTASYIGAKNYPKPILQTTEIKGEDLPRKKSRIYVVQLEEYENRRGVMFKYESVTKNISEDLKE